MKKDDIQLLQLEMTSYCNAACPQCSRTEEGSSYHLAEVNYDDIINWFDTDFTEQLKKILYNGSFGDAVMVNDLPKICEYFISYNVRNSINTNGSLRTISWWTDLGNLFKKSINNVTFSIDGLEDTNHLYRINTNWDKIIENAQAYISTGAHATWNFIVFKHNEHQVEEAKKLAKKLGFKMFHIKGSHRGNVFTSPNLFQSEAFAFPNTEKTNKIYCDALQNNSLYIDFNGDVWPCAMIGVKKYLKDNEIRQILDVYPENFNNLRYNKLEEILDHKFFIDIKEVWGTEKQLKVCSKHCNTPITRCNLQFLKRVVLNQNI